MAELVSVDNICTKLKNLLISTKKRKKKASLPLLGYAPHWVDDLRLVLIAERMVPLLPLCPHDGFRRFLGRRKQNQTVGLLFIYSSC